MEATRDLPAPWRAKTAEAMLVAASARSRMILPQQQERSARARDWYSRTIKDVTEKLRWKRTQLAGEFHFIQISELEEMFPGDTRLPVIRDLEARLSILKTELNLELNRLMSEEADKENADLMVTMRSGDSPIPHSVFKVVVGGFISM